MRKIWIVGPESGARTLLGQCLLGEGHELTVFGDVNRAAESLGNTPPEAVCCEDLEDPTFAEFCRGVSGLEPGIPLVLFSLSPTTTRLADALAKGVNGYLNMSADPEGVRSEVGFVFGKLLPKASPACTA